MIREEYFCIFIFLCAVFFVATAFLGISWLRAKRRSYCKKNTPYECGFDSFDETLQNARRQFNVQFYLIAIIFIIFELEIVFLFPWAVSLEYIGWPGFWSMLVFLGILIIGFVYEWKKGVFEWQ